jgi:hypothetical protein
MVLEAIKSYDAQTYTTDNRADFLAYFRQQQKSTGEVMPDKELMNHLTNNLLVNRRDSPDPCWLPVLTE